MERFTYDPAETHGDNCGRAQGFIGEVVRRLHGFDDDPTFGRNPDKYRYLNEVRPLVDEAMNQVVDWFGTLSDEGGESLRPEADPFTHTEAATERAQAGDVRGWFSNLARAKDAHWELHRLAADVNELAELHRFEHE